MLHQCFGISPVTSVRLAGQLVLELSVRIRAPDGTHLVLKLSDLAQLAQLTQLAQLVLTGFRQTAESGLRSRGCQLADGGRSCQLQKLAEELLLLLFLLVKAFAGGFRMPSFEAS